MCCWNEQVGGELRSARCQQVEQVAAETDAAHIVKFVEEQLGGTVTAIERIPRWRAGWYLTLERDGTRIELYARGERGPDFPSPFDLEHEARVHHLLEANGVPVPHVYGLAEGPVRTLVMTRVPGQQGLALARDDLHAPRADDDVHRSSGAGAPHRERPPA